MKKIILWILLLLHFYSYSQTKRYYNEKIKEIDSISYYKQCNIKAFKCYSLTKNDTVFNVIYNKFEFGKLSKKELKEIQTVVKPSITEENMIIFFSDSLLTFEEYKRAHYKYVKQFNKEHDNITTKLKVKTDKRIWKDRAIIVKRGNKCINKYKKLHTKLVYYYARGGGDLSFYLKFKWRKDIKKLMKHTFFKYNKNYKFVIVKSNGEFLLVGSLLTSKKIKKLLKTENWSHYKKELQAFKTNETKKGFFCIMPHKHNCIE